MPKISVIVPVYNVEKYLRRCIGCLLKQTFSDYELILVDDGSTDKSGTICDEYEKKDSRIRVIHQENSGAAIARNTGLEKATGDFIMFCDSDDIVSEFWIEHLLCNLSDNELIMPLCGICNSASDLGKKECDYNKKILEKNELISSAEWHKLGYLVNTVFSSIVIKQFNLRFRTQKDKADYNEDLLFVVSYLTQVDKVCYNGYFDYGYIIHSDSFSRQISTELYFEKYAEKYDIWLDFVNRYGLEKDISIVSDNYLYYFFIALTQELKSYQSFKKILLSDQVRMCVNNSTCKNENPRIIKLIKEKRPLKLWLYLNLSKMKRKEN